MIDLKSLEAWFVTGSQHLYGDEVLKQVAADSQAICQGLAGDGTLPIRIVFKPVMTGPEAIRDICQEANGAANCIGLVTWMHTFSPAKMWIAGLRALTKPFLHLHTQFNRDIPWSSMDMNFMNLNQSAHGDREFGYICSRMGRGRSVVVGHWQDRAVMGKLSTWARAAAAWHDSQNLKVARFGDNMRQVAVTEGDKVEAQMRFGYSVNGYGMGDLVAAVSGVSEAEVDRLCGQYDEQYAVAESLR
jgi:L-arabinose isomerase